MDQLHEHVSNCRQAIAEGHKTFDLVYYVTGAIIRNYTIEEIKNNRDYLIEQLNWLENLTAESTSEEGMFYHEQIIELQKELNNKI